MGIDACIYIKSHTNQPRLEVPLPRCYSVASKYDDGPQGSTHSIETVLERYYGPGYERGPWPTLCAVLMTLMNSPDIEMVWYGGDHEMDPQLMTPDRLCEITRHFIEHGERPYRGPWTT